MLLMTDLVKQLWIKFFNSTNKSKFTHLIGVAFTGVFTVLSILEILVFFLKSQVFEHI